MQNPSENKPPQNSTSPYSTFEEFWPFYLSQHSESGTRVMHFIGTSLGIFYFITCIIAGFSIFRGLVGALFSGYAFAWMGHYFVEKNTPATFTYPWWSFKGDFKMWYLMLTGKLDDELKKHLG